MPPQARGSVVELKTQHGVSFALRFRAGGQRQYRTLGLARDGWTRRRAEDALQDVMSDVRNGRWKSPEQQAAEAVPEKAEPTFHQFASEWYAANRDGWRESTRIDYEWQLSSHLLPFFADHRLSAISPQEVDRYKSMKLRESAERKAELEKWRARHDGETDPAKRRAIRVQRPPRELNPSTINKTLARLSQILDVALEYGLVERNAAKGKRRRVKASKSAPVWLDSAQAVEALLDAAGELDREARADRRHIPRKALLATLTFAGLRIGELLDLRWRDIDLSAGRITVRASKTDAGRRVVDMLPVLRDELLALKASHMDVAATARVFGTAEGTRQSESNVRNRILAPAVKRANERLGEAGEVPLPDGLTPHKLRHTYASLLVALGVDPGSVMDQLGHADAGFTLSVYRHGMRRDMASREALRRLVGVADQAGTRSQPEMFGHGLGISGVETTVTGVFANTLENEKTLR